MNIHARTAAIAPLLGDEWTARDCAAEVCVCGGTEGRAVIHGPRNATILVSCTRGDRIWFIGVNHRSLAKFSAGLEPVRLGLPGTYTDEQLAANLRQELLPPYLEQLAELRARRARHRRNHAEREQLQRRLLSTLGPGAQPAGRPWGQHDHCTLITVSGPDDTGGTVSVFLPAAERQIGLVRFAVSVPWAQAPALAESVRAALDAQEQPRDERAPQECPDNPKGARRTWGAVASHLLRHQ